jgi:hypothetical protein
MSQKKQKYNHFFFSISFLYQLGGSEVGLSSWEALLFEYKGPVFLKDVVPNMSLIY